MDVQNKYEISDLVKFGPYMSMVTGIRLTGDPLNILYEISFFDGCDSYKTLVANDYELESKKKEFGFGDRGLKKERERLEAEGAPLKSPFDPRFDHLNRGNQDDM